MNKKLVSAVALILIISALAAFGQNASAAIVPTGDDSHFLKYPDGSIRLNNSELNGSLGYHFASGLRNNWIKLHYRNSGALGMLDPEAKLYYTTNGLNPSLASNSITLSLEGMGVSSSGYYDGNLTTSNFTGLADGAEITFIVKVTGTSSIQTTDTLWDNNTAAQGGKWPSGYGYRYKLDRGRPVISNVQAKRSGLDVGGYVDINAAVADATAGVGSVKVNIAWPNGYTENKTMTADGFGVYHYNTTYSVIGTYTYFIWANDMADNSAFSTSRTFIVANVPPQISGVQASPQVQVSGGSVNVTATVVDDAELSSVKLNVVSGPPGFESFEVPMARAGLNSYYYNRTYSLAGTYSYFIRASDASDNGRMSPQQTFTIVTVPAKVAGLNATPGNGQVSLSWPAPYDGGSAIIKYRVYRSATAGGAATLIGEPATANYVDTGLVNGQAYYYGVSAVNAAGEGVKSDTVSATPQPASVLPTTPLGIHASSGIGWINITWNLPDSNGGSAIVRYKIYRNGGAYASVDSPKAYYNDTGAASGVSYSYAISAVNAVGEGPKSAGITASALVPPAAPAKVTGLTAAAGNGQVSLSWTAPANGGSAITGYKIYWGTTSTPASAIAASGTATTYIHTGLTNGQIYYYQVSAVNALGDGAKSNVVSATPLVGAAEDSDHDGLPDAWEKKYFGNLTYGPNDDPDGDGYTNLQEYNAGSDPTDSASRPPVWSWWYPAVAVIFIAGIVLALLVMRRR
ncbi:MAG: fibronectin type III domain-containing protein [Candidatus Thermoplasmatota archaeon]|nr:fibronectin type III domain-containing protein [Candidatus Thermoplasmatota archaeon]